MTIQAYTVRANRQKARIWIEGKRLAAAGFTRGTPYAVISNEKARTLTLIAHHSESKRKVAGKDERPIIDLTGGTCAPFIEGDAVEIAYQNGVITIY